MNVPRFTWQQLLLYGFYRIKWSEVQEMKNVILFKMPFKTKAFRKGQKVWVQETSGNLAAKVIGKFKGKYRYVSCWVNWRSNEKQSPIFMHVSVNDDFAIENKLKGGGIGND